MFNSSTKRNSNLAAKRLICLKFAALSALAPLVFTPTPALASASKNCKDVEITIQNDSSKPIKLIDLEYDTPQTFDKNEFVRNRVIPADSSWTTTRNLEGVKGYDVTLQAQYRTLTDKSRWSWSVSKTDSDAAQCSNGSQYTVVIG